MSSLTSERKIQKITMDLLPVNQYGLGMIYTRIITTMALSMINLRLYTLSAVCRYAFPIKCTNVVFADDNETVCEIHAEYDPEIKTRLKVLSLTISINTAIV